MNKLIKGIVNQSTDHYVPKNIPVKILLNKNNLPIAIHRLDNGDGTFLSNKYDQKKTIWTEIM